MKKISELIKSYLLQCILVVVAIIVIVIISLNFKAQKTIEKVEAKVEEKIPEKVMEEAKEKIKVDVKGSVVNPGVYELEIGARVSDAIFLAGGVTENGNTSTINLAKTLQDEMVIIVYSNEQIAEYKNGNKVTEYVYIEIEKCPDTMNNACINSESTGNQTKDNSSKEIENTTISENKLISLNQATKEELMTLPNIGESKAKAIIEYRNTNGNFKTIDDILNVSGIGNSVFEKIKDSITV